VVEFALRLPREHKMDGARTKIILKDVLARHVPRAAPRQIGSTRSVAPGGKPGELGEDRGWRCGPDERPGVGIVLGEVPG
jgi:hypothetical protein